MPIYFQLILFVFIIKSISSQNLASKIIELLNENNSIKSSLNDFINNDKNILDNIPNDLLNLYNNNFGIKYIPNSKKDKVNKNINENAISKPNRYLTSIIKEPSEIKPILDFIKFYLLKNCTELIDLIYNYSDSPLLFILKEFDILPYLQKYKKYAMQICTNENIKNTIDLIDLLQNENHIKFITEIIENYLNNRLVNYIRNNSSKNDLKDCHPQFINNLINIIYNYIKNFKLREDIINYIFDREIQRMKLEQKLPKYNISPNCSKLLKYTFLGSSEDEQKDYNTIKFYRSKFFEVNKDKNDFSYHEKCLQFDKDKKNNYLDNEPVLVFSIIDGTYQNKNNKNNALFEKYYFIVNNCLPQGYYDNKTTQKKEALCSKEDYNSIVGATFDSFLYNKLLGVDSNNLRINSFIVKKDRKPELSYSEKIILIIAVILLIFPFIIYSYLFLYKKIKIKNKKNGQIINKLDIDVNEENKDNEDEEEEEEIIKEEPKKVAFPKRIILLNYFFNLRENFKELFNFKSNLTNINNMNGLNYIKGLIGLSMILIVFGHTYFLLFNLPLKKYGQWSFYKMMSSFFYFIPMLGLRYSPRFILSCSGFTFTYKYLSFLDKKQNNYFLKFLFQQSHRYFLLILIFLGKPLSYLINSFVMGNSPMAELFNYFIKKPEKLVDYFKSFISFKLNDNFKFQEYYRNSQDLFDYFWLTFNEVLFFIIGLILISIGYKFKFRIDLIIIISFISIYLLKIILYYIFNKKEGRIYSTLYYYIIGYGKIMLLPNFNLSYFFIGMFFGLMQYTVQKVIPEIEQNGFKIVNLNKDINLLKDEEEKMMPKIEKNYCGNRVSYNYDLFSFDNKKEKEGFASEKDLESNLLDSNSTKIRRNRTGKFSDDFFKKEKNNNNSNKIEDDDDNSIKRKDSISNLDYMVIDKANDNKVNISIKEEMPFFKLTIPIIKWHKKYIDNMAFFLTIIFFMIVILILLIFSYMFFFNININTNLESLKKLEFQKYLEKLKLEDILTDKFFNFLYLVDIELVVLLLHWAAFIISIREQNRIYDFLRNDFWNFFTKSYFSYLLLLNPIILYILYGNGTVIRLEIYSIYIYSAINFLLILIGTIFVYVVYELPLKKIIKYIISRDYNNIYHEQEKILNGKDEEEN